MPVTAIGCDEHTRMNCHLEATGPDRGIQCHPGQTQALGSKSLDDRNGPASTTLFSPEIIGKWTKAVRLIAGRQSNLLVAAHQVHWPFLQVDAVLDQLAAARSRHRAVRQWVALEVLVIQWDSPLEFGWQTWIDPGSLRSPLPSPANYASAPERRRHGSMPPQAD